MGGVKTNDMRAHGTQKTKTTSTWPANKSPAMCKTGHEHAANKKLISHVFTQDMTT